MKTIPFLLILIILSMSSCSFPIVERPSKSPTGIVISPGQVLHFSKGHVKGSISWSGDYQRIISINGKVFSISVLSRTEGLGRGGGVNPKFGVYSPGESFAPHFGTSIVYNESIKDFKELENAKEDLLNALLYSKKEGDRIYIADPSGFRISLGGSFATGRISVDLIKITANGAPVVVNSSNTDNGKIWIRTKTE